MAKGNRLPGINLSMLQKKFDGKVFRLRTASYTKPYVDRQAKRLVELNKKSKQFKYYYRIVKDSQGWQLWSRRERTRKKGKK